jgi:hypothetical protein
MERHEYRAPRRLTILACIASAVLVLLGLASVLGAAANLDQGGLAGMIIGAIITVMAVAFGVQMIEGRTLVVTDDGIHGFRLWHRMDIPWSSVRSVEVVDLHGRMEGASTVCVRLDNGKRIQLPATPATHERATRITEELLEALRKSTQEDYKA